MGVTIQMVIMVWVVMIMVGRVSGGNGDYKKINYGEALTKSILFFEGQRSGKLPSSQRLNWRKDSALHDGDQVHVNLVGGYYDAGDNIKFNFPMAYSTTMLAWSVLEFGKFMGSDLKYALEAVRWGADYLLRATSVPGIVYVQVGDPYADHNCWERPEDMDTPRTVYAVSPDKPGSEVSAEIAAALAATSIVFKYTNPLYSAELLNRSATVFNFADKYQGSYSDSLGQWVCPFYCDYSGYKDELIWAASWLHWATNKRFYWNYVVNNIHTLESKPKFGLDRTHFPKFRVAETGPYRVGGINYEFGAKKPDTFNGVGNFAEFGWDSKNAGINIFLSKLLLKGKGTRFVEPFQSHADKFICTILPESPSRSVQYSPGGLLFKSGGSNMQHPTALSFLLLVYARNLNYANKVINCGNGVIATPSRLIQVAKSQVDYILGNNPLNMSYMVGYGEKFPQRIHHRGSSIPSVDQHEDRIECKSGTPYFESKGPNPNLLVGAVVGGPDINDAYADSRSQFVQSEPTTYINAPFVGLLAYFKNHPLT